ncbi:hypothetical protein E2C01_097650 [Portunus trituberculatus]|uniref:Uncharacterized protein n=1 Tax=Portunus trituberculatus TaxID=210409 RepID=A0A5B7JVQ9_PORTR|nr:hypothetical protein [Portunus trituberculatus]
MRERRSGLSEEGRTQVKDMKEGQPIQSGHPYTTITTTTTTTSPIHHHHHPSHPHYLQRQPIHHHHLLTPTHSSPFTFQDSPYTTTTTTLHSITPYLF